MPARFNGQQPEPAWPSSPQSRRPCPLEKREKGSQSHPYKRRWGSVAASAFEKNEGLQARAEIFRRTPLIE